MRVSRLERRKGGKRVKKLPVIGALMAAVLAVLALRKKKGAAETPDTGPGEGQASS